MHACMTANGEPYHLERLKGLARDIWNSELGTWDGNVTLEHATLDSVHSPLEYRYPYSKEDGTI